MRYRRVIGGTVEDAEAKFPWLRRASFRNAIIDISGGVLVWENGFWDNGLWKNGIWENGVWRDGVWKDGLWMDGLWMDGVWMDGVWKDGGWENGVWDSGVWESGRMWSNVQQDHVPVKQEGGVFKEVDER